MKLDFLKNIPLPPLVLCHLAHDTCHVSRVTCHVSHVQCDYFFYKGVQLVNGLDGLLSKGPSLSSLEETLKTCLMYVYFSSLTLLYDEVTYVYKFSFFFIFWVKKISSLSKTIMGAALCLHSSYGFNQQINACLYHRVYKKEAEKKYRFLVCIFDHP